jgi:hypothetical protein
MRRSNSAMTLSNFVGWDGTLADDLSLLDESRLTA